MLENNCLSYWYPKVAGLVPTPETLIIRTQLNLEEFVEHYNRKDELLATDFYGKLLRACNRIGYPVFLKTGHFSGKHNWRNTCYLETSDDLLKHVLEITEMSMCAGFGLPTNVWAVREVLPVTRYFVAERYGNLPISKEVRAFIRDGAVQCVHPYWPSEAIKQGMTAISSTFDAVYESLCEINENDKKQIDNILASIGPVFKGYWSVDMLKSANGKWYLIDMAAGDLSFHWESCEYKKDIRLLSDAYSFS
ncbi:hypothetical protein ADMFC3_26700 [Geovibrio sp. ADMFC3]